MSEIIRAVQKHELSELMELYKHLNNDDPTLLEDALLPSP